MAAAARAQPDTWLDLRHNAPENVLSSRLVATEGRLDLHAGESSLAPGKWQVLAVEGFDEDPWGSSELAAALRKVGT